LPILSKEWPVPICIALNSNVTAYFDERIGLHNGLSRSTKIAVIREFYTSLCPEYIIEGQSQSRNAFIVQRLEEDKWKSKDLFMCSPSLLKKNKIPLHVYPGTGGQVEKETAAEAFDPDFAYTVKRIYHDDRCGSGTGSNAYIVNFAK
jgi:hypothetical protein